MPYDLCDTDEVKEALELTTSDHDDLIGTLITQASVAIAQRYQREFIGPTGGTRYFKVASRFIDLAPYDLRAVTSVTLNPEEASPLTLAENSDFVLEPLGGAPLGGSWMSLRLSSRIALTSNLATEFGFAKLRIVGDWGCYAEASSLDDAVKRAAIVTVSSWMDRGAAEYGMGGDGGREMIPDRAATYAIPAAAHSILQPWGRVGPI